MFKYIFVEDLMWPLTEYYIALDIKILGRILKKCNTKCYNLKLKKVYMK